MTPLLTNQDIVIRLALTVVASALIGWNRGEHGRSAGLRTNILVCLASSVSMILANSLLGTTGKAPNSFVNLDVMRLPLGILTGIGFIGAGAILRHGGLVWGVTTAATLWYVTVMGLCFGAGQLGLGVAMLGLGLGVLGGLRWFERSMKTRQYASFAIVVEGENPSDSEITACLKSHGYNINLWSIEDMGRERRIHCHLHWLGVETPCLTPACVKELKAFPDVRKVSWEPLQ